MKSRSLIVKIVISMIVINIISVSIITTLYYLQSKDALYNRTYIQLSQVKNLKLSYINSLFENAKFEITSFSKNLSSIVQNHQLDSLLSSTKLFNSLIIYDLKTDSVINSSTNANLILDGIKTNLNNNSLIEIFQLKNHSIFKNQLYLSSKLEENIFLIGELNYTNIINILKRDESKPLIDHSIEAYLISEDGTLLTPSIFINDAVLKVKYPANFLNDVYASLSSEEFEYLDYRGKPVLRSSQEMKFKHFKWLILVEIDKDEVDSPFASMWRNTFIVLVFITLFITIISYFFAQKITSPIKSLSKASKKMAAGEYPQSIEIKTNDEIGLLTNNFNLMIEKLQEQDKELERERNERLNAYIIATEAERKRIASELHDGVGQSLIALKLQLECIDFNNQNKSEQIINSTKQLLDDTIEEMRNMSNNLLPNVLVEFGLKQAVKQMLNYCSKSDELQLDFTDELKSDLKIAQKDEVQIYRIIQEAFKNSISHSSANKIEVIFSEDKFNYIFAIKDNGKGFNAENKKNYGNGLYNIKERVNLINAEIQINTSIETGTEIIIMKKKQND